MMPRACTFAIEGDELGEYWLRVEDGRGSFETIAHFEDQNAMALFTRALDHAKLSAYEAGRLGL